MHSSLKYLLALSAAVTLSQSQAEMVQSSFNNDNESSSLAARVLNKEAQSFNSHFSNLNSLSITERSGDQIRRQTIAAKNFYRPRNQEILKKYSSTFKPLKLVTIDKEFGGWDKVQKQHFENGGVFDQIVKANSAK